MVAQHNTAILPRRKEANANGTFPFFNRQTNSWYDPPFVNVSEYDVTGGTFASFETPPIAFNSGLVELLVGTTDIGSIAPLTPHRFGAGVTESELIGISPFKDEANSGFPSSYPVLLNFNGLLPFPSPSSQSQNLLHSPSSSLVFWVLAHSAAGPRT
jgi:hypothetical protein